MDNTRLSGIELTSLMLGKMIKLIFYYMYIYLTMMYTPGLEPQTPLSVSQKLN